MTGVITQKTLKIASWNVGGLKSIIKKGFLTPFANEENADIYCLQETKTKRDDITVLLRTNTGVLGNRTYEYFDHNRENESRSGTAFITKIEPINVTKGIGSTWDHHDKEGRTITAEFEKFFLVNVYVPNSGSQLVRLDYRVNQWDNEFRGYLKKLAEKKEVICCGDFNVAHEDIDIRNPTANLRTAGFTTDERKSFSNLVKPFSVMQKQPNPPFYMIDTFRHFHPKQEGAFTFWTNRQPSARSNNAGWRAPKLEITSQVLSMYCNIVTTLKELLNTEIWYHPGTDQQKSSHCPIVLEIDAEQLANFKRPEPAKPAEPTK